MTKKYNNPYKRHLLCTHRAFITVILTFLTLNHAVCAKETLWRYMKVDDVEIIADISEKELIRYHDNIHYFNRVLNKFLMRKLKQRKRNMQAIITSSRKKFESIIGEHAKTGSGVFGGAPSIKIIVLREGQEDMV